MKEKIKKHLLLVVGGVLVVIGIILSRIAAANLKLIQLVLPASLMIYVGVGIVIVYGFIQLYKRFFKKSREMSKQVMIEAMKEANKNNKD